MLEFQSTAELEQWLHAQDVDTALWGQGAAKRSEDLLAEIRKGESIMRPEPPLRTVVAVRVVVRRGDYVLIEASQGMQGGRRRARERPPSEKMYPGEHYADAAIRCLREELDVAPEQIDLKPESYRRKVWSGNPASYPGLHTRYTFHIVDAEVHGLPGHDFSTQELARGSGEPVDRHFWEWRKRRDLR